MSTDSPGSSGSSRVSQSKCLSKNGSSRHDPGLYPLPGSNSTDSDWSVLFRDVCREVLVSTVGCNHLYRGVTLIARLTHIERSQMISSPKLTWISEVSLAGTLM